MIIFFKEHLNHEATADPSAAKEILDSIEEVYYRDETFDTSEYELKVQNKHIIFKHYFILVNKYM